MNMKKYLLSFFISMCSETFIINLKKPLFTQRFYQMQKNRTNESYYGLSHQTRVLSLSGPCLVIASFTLVVFTDNSDVG
jgi:hypothetical protein